MLAVDGNRGVTMARRRRWRAGVLLLGAIWMASAAWQAFKPLPEGVGIAFPWRAAADAAFLADRTFVDAEGARHSEQQIFDAAFSMIGQAQQLIVLDMFLFNDFAGAGGTALRPLSRELTRALLDRMAQVPGLRVIVITDPINTVYGALRLPNLGRLEAAGASVIVTDLSRLRASNPIWSGPWALCCGWAGNSTDAGWLPDPFGSEPITLRGWLALPNFRANHRKTLVVDRDGGWEALVTSGNPHDASSAHGNVALRFSGEAAGDLIASESAAAAFSGVQLDGLPSPAPVAALAGPQLRVLTESAIREAVLETLAAAQPGERVELAMFYLSHRAVIAALKAAQARGVGLRVLLDPNEDAFGRKKNGVPNRQVARELVAAGVPLRWCDTHGEQCHAKLLLHRGAREATLIAGSANFTRRNLDDLNLETSVQLVASADHPAMREAVDWFDEAWSNPPGRGFSVEPARYADDSILRRAWYRIGESTGLSTW
jgi:phosphatidylserine/phosphatidylglycerophosphate/cardiolipin synthase-like enzyme